MLGQTNKSGAISLPVALTSQAQMREVHPVKTAIPRASPRPTPRYLIRVGKTRTFNAIVAPVAVAQDKQKRI